MENDTILVYTSDHGSMFGSQGVGGKRQPYEESIRVPFFVRWPGRIEAKKKVDNLFGTIDVVPTLCALAGVHAPSKCRGLDFSGHLLGTVGPAPKSQFIMHIAKANASGNESHPAPLFRGVRTKRHTYFVTDKGDGSLFDNKKDPYQMKNEFVSAGARIVRDKCEKLTRAWMTSANATFGDRIRSMLPEEKDDRHDSRTTICCARRADTDPVVVAPVPRDGRQTVWQSWADVRIEARSARLASRYPNLHHQDHIAGPNTVGATAAVVSGDCGRQSYKAPRRDSRFARRQRSRAR